LEIMNLELRHLQMVLAIHEASSVTAASERLNVTQSALSHQLKEIEARLQTQLFLRVRKKMVLTAAGQAVLRAARPILQQVEAAEEEIRLLNDDHAGTITISTQCYTCYHWLPPVLTRFQKQHPDVDVQIDVDATRTTVKSLLEGRIDVAILNHVPDDHAIELTPLFEDEMLLVTSDKHRLAKSLWVRPSQLATEHLILHTAPHENTFNQTVLVPAGVRPARYSQVNLTEAIVELVRANLGVSAMADWAIAPYEQQGGLKTITVSKSGIRRRWYAATRRAERRPRYLDRFLETLSATPFPVRRRKT
jgi:LysR family transcriptional regulator, regulator for metE and metH